MISLSSATKTGRLFTKKTSYHFDRISIVGEVERCNSSSVVLASSCEIMLHFSRLANAQQCFSALQKLNKIAQRQRFTVSERYFNSIFNVIRNSSNIAESIRPTMLANSNIIDENSSNNNCICTNNISSYCTNNISSNMYNINNNINSYTNSFVSTNFNGTNNSGFTLNNSNFVVNNVEIPNADDIVESALKLLDRIASFSGFYVKNNIKINHITELYNLLPHELAFKSLGKLLALNPEFPMHVCVNLGLNKLIPFVTANNNNGANECNDSVNMTLLFIWFLGSFAMFPELNRYMVPLYEQFVLNNCLSPNEMIRKYCYDTLTILASSSPEMCDWISSSSVFSSIFQICPTIDTCAKKYLDLVHVFIRNGVTSFVSSSTSSISDNILLNYVIKESLNMKSSNINCELAITACDILAYLIQIGFAAIIVECGIDDFVFEFALDCENNGGVSFKAKEAAMNVACLLFLHANRQLQVRYTSKGIAEVIETTIETGSAEFHLAGVCALKLLMKLAEEENYSSLNNSIQNILDLLDAEKYSQIMSDINY